MLLRNEPAFGADCSCFLACLSICSVQEHERSQIWLLPGKFSGMGQYLRAASQLHGSLETCLQGKGNGDYLKQPEGVTTFNEKPTSSPQASYLPWHPWGIRLTAQVFMDTGHGDFPIRQTFVHTALLVLLLIILHTGPGHPWHCYFA